MRKSKTLMLATLLSVFLIVNQSYSQQWNGSSTSNGNIYRDGYVGIGTTIPIGKLSIEESQALFFISDGTNSNERYASTIVLAENQNSFNRSGGLQYDGYNNKLHIVTSNNGNSSNVTNLSKRITINETNGYVGIGTTIPIGKLSIEESQALFFISDGTNSNERYASTIVLAENQNSFNRSGGLQYDGYNNKLHIVTSNNGNSSNVTNLAKRITINETNGNVGIGTDNPTTKFTVNGTITAEEIIVEQVGADFVFDDDYQLRSLAETEEYISINKHLPDIPSAEVMRQNGVAVGEFQNKMLQKIEELTLYMIDLKKENTELQRKIDKFGNKN